MMAVLASFIGHEVVWFVAVIFAGRGEAWPGVIAALTRRWSIARTTA
jgi:hypothetical protein